MLFVKTSKYLYITVLKRKRFIKQIFNPLFLKPFDYSLWGKTFNYPRVAFKFGHNYSPNALDSLPMNPSSRKSQRGERRRAQLMTLTIVLWFTGPLTLFLRPKSKWTWEV